MDKINKISKDFEEVSELKALCEKQYRELVSLLEKNKLLESEVEHLKTLLVSNDSFIIPAQNISLEEMICLEQIAILKKNSQVGELTLEESKKVDLYIKALRIIRNKDGAQQDSLSGFKTDDLLKVLDAEIK
jgi:hypothetical protein